MSGTLLLMMRDVELGGGYLIRLAGSSALSPKRIGESMSYSRQASWQDWRTRWQRK